ncbi:MAG: hypothetical protein FWD47_11435 [Treponema sp.]|nr:hypothetical protein [Treponema sp.]
MKADVFRHIDFWKSTLMTMADNLFFELIRSVFGKIKTPFNKQQLLNDLESFLLNYDIQKTIGAYIDNTDKKIIAAVAVLNEPSFEQLEIFFAGEIGFVQLQDFIVNLEERFILYRFSEDRPNILKTISLYTNNTKVKTCLALNPVLKSVLEPITRETSVLFPAEIDEKTILKVQAEKPITKTNLAIINDLIFAAFYSFSCSFESFFVPEGIIRKRVKQEGKTIFPDIDLEKTYGTLQILGLFYINGEKCVPDKKYFDDFILLSPLERMEYYAGALLVYSELNTPLEILPPLYKNKVKEIVNFIHCFIQSINSITGLQDQKEDTSRFPVKTLGRMVEVLKTQPGLSIEIKNDSFLSALEETGLIETTDDNLYRLCAAAYVPDVQDTQSVSGTQSTPVIAIDSASSILVYPEINFKDAIKLASILNISKTDSVIGSKIIRFELNKSSVVRSFNSNINAEEIIDFFKKLLGEGSDLNETIIWNLKDWEKRHTEVSLKKGIVLSLSQEHQYLTETKPFTELITETLAPGLYLLNEDSFDEADEALRDAGIDIIAYPASQPKRKEKKEPSYSLPASPVNHFSSPSSSFVIKAITKTGGKKEKGLKDDSTALTEKFHNMLEKMPLNETEKSELSARIERRLVLSESQLKDANVRYEKLTARNMDYAGKQSIARQAINSSSPVEIIWKNKGEEQKVFGIPRVLEKDGNDLILVVNLTNENPNAKNTNNLRVPLAKMSLLRRIKKSIFEE